MKTPLKIYLCDPTHDTIILVSDTIPINIGFIGSYAKHIYGDDIDVSLFKYPQTIIDAIKTCPPDIIGLSNYSWNSNLSECLARLAKKIKPNVITVQGGTNFPHKPEQQLEFLKQRVNTDLHTQFEAEVAFSNIVARVLTARDGGQRVYDSPIDGCVFVEPSTRWATEPSLVTGALPERLKTLDDIPSPYLNGMLDHFFDGRLPPFLETNRGCPFKCSFCHTGADYFRKMNMFSIDRVREELNYIGPRAAKHGITFLHIADTNFGMFPRDRDICMALHKVKEQTGWPLNVVATTGKNNKERVIEITGILGNLFSVTMSVQTMDESVLSNIRRSNIKLDHYAAINKHLLEQGRTSRGELILGLPGETKESFIRGIGQVIDAGVTGVTIYSLMLLHGTEFQDPVYREKYQLEGKFRIVPLNYGEYAGEYIFDFEEVGVANKDMSFEDYLYVRGYALIIETLHNGRPFEEFFRYVEVLDVSRTDFLRLVYDTLDQAPASIRTVMADFMAETSSELWDTQEELISHYKKPEHYQELVDGKVGGNLMYKYKCKSIVFCANAWIDFLAELTKKIALDNISVSDTASTKTDEIDHLSNYCKNKVSGLLDVTADVRPIYMESRYNIAAWLDSDPGSPLRSFLCEMPVRYEFVYSNDQLRLRKDQFTRYGTDINALSKIVTRVSNFEGLYRQVRAGANPVQDPAGEKSDALTRYALSN